MLLGIASAEAKAYYFNQEHVNMGNVENIPMPTPSPARVATPTPRPKRVDLTYGSEDGMPSSMMSRALDDLFTYESLRGALSKQVDKAGGTVGNYHVTAQARKTYNIPEDMPEKEQAQMVLEGMRDVLRKGGPIYKSVTKNDKKVLVEDGLGHLPPINFDALTEHQQRAALTYVYNTGLNQRNFREALAMLSNASETYTIEDMDELAEMTAGFMDVARISSKDADGLVARRLGEQLTFLNAYRGKKVEKEDDGLSSAERSQIIRSRAQASLMKMQNIKARQEITSGMSYKGNVVL